MNSTILRKTGFDRLPTECLQWSPISKNLIHYNFYFASPICLYPCLAIYCCNNCLINEPSLTEQLHGCERKLFLPLNTCNPYDKTVFCYINAARKTCSRCVRVNMCVTMCVCVCPHVHERKSQHLICFLLQGIIFPLF